MAHFDSKRRQFLQFAAFGTMVAAWPGFILVEAAKMNNASSSAFKPDVEIELTARPDTVSLKPGAATKVFKYHAQLIKGPTTTLTNMPSYLGPILNFVRGQKVRIIAYNDLPEPTVAHWHGLHVPQKMDGHPMYAINPGERYIYEFEIKNPAGTNWYHAHTHEKTATQVYQGLAGLITISDEQEQKLALPNGEYDLPLVIQDRRLTVDNQLQYLQHGRRERMLGFLGDTILINGQINRTIPVKTRAYRLRLLNASNSRIYKLGWEDGTPLTAIGTDGALLEKPETFPYIMLAPAERVELWVDFSGREVGSDLILQSLEYHGVMPHMGGGMRGGMGMMRGGLAQGSKFPLVKFHIAEKTSESPQLPAQLIKFQRLTDRDVANPDKPIQIGLSMRHMSPELNHRSFEMLAVAEGEKIPVNTIQKIRIYQEEHGMHGGGRRGMGRMEDDADGMEGRGGMRSGRGGMMEMAHPIHLHEQQFQILSRLIKDSHGSGYATVKDGFINSGWKDTVLVMPGEEVTIIKPFQDYTGLYLYHCHNLEHEDMGMMRNFLVS
ncbi:MULTISPECIES: multicopper oxidase family protein [Nitrosomonas]|uniref:Bilirubin oxidase n=1 Tax=Nitrosomonas communis TaxID=44574 RepID=A0A0F7KGD6_9PROT|nr:MULTISPECIES: multicopper oxidase domain-containing protein [Nitrosomonas]AKH37864.1 bilirubin oxidase [Nitrosomonas communis]TYP92857.1 suppressor of ftsI/bilirubin oxidase [Nitrosomonas communis]UVS63217.1 multicopper oxidase domain-containing protein [Nitrosomonas sp. PLL12]